MSELFSLFTLCYNNTVDTRNGFLGHWWQLIGVVVNQPEIPKLSCPLGARNWDKAHILCIVQVLGSLRFGLCFDSDYGVSRRSSNSEHAV